MEDSKKLRNPNGIPKQIVNAIAVIYSSNKSKVRLGEKLSEAFHITTGVLQGDTLAPFLFIIILDYILKQTDPNHGIKTHLPDSDVSLPDLDFADDIVSFDSKETAAGEHLQNLEREAATVGLKINGDKSKILLVNYQFSNQLPTSLEKLEIVEDFKYLGAKIVSSYDDFKRRCGIAWSKFWRLEKVWRSTKISLKLKLRLFDSLILSWTTTQKLKNELNAFGTSCYRMLLNTRKIDRSTNQHVLNVTQRKHLSKILLSK